MAYGTLTTLDTLATLDNTTVAEYGEDRVYDGIADALDTHNAIMTDAMGALVVRSTDRQRRYGSTAEMEMQELDEYGTPDAQKVTAGVTVGFPLKDYGGALQWTRHFLLNATPAEIAAQVNAMMDADVRNVTAQIKTALFRATNYTFDDRLVDHIELSVKALVNADSAAIPLGPNGESFTAASHTHYNYTAGTSLAATDVDALLEDVIEHFGTGQIMLYINRAQETAIRAFSKFNAYVDSRIVPAYNSDYATGRALDAMQLNNRAIGIYDQAEVWVKPWIPAGYLLAFIDGVPAPLLMRTRRTDTGDLELRFENEAYPLRARGYGREFGVGVWTRTNGAVLYIDSGSAGAYVVPTF